MAGSRRPAISQLRSADGETNRPPREASAAVPGHRTRSNVVRRRRGRRDRLVTTNWCRSAAISRCSAVRDRTKNWSERAQSDELRIVLWRPSVSVKEQSRAHRLGKVRWGASALSAASTPSRLHQLRPIEQSGAERFVRSVKDECLNRVVPLGERHLRLILHEYATHYHRERNHQGLRQRADRSSAHTTRSWCGSSPPATRWDP